MWTTVERHPDGSPRVRWLTHEGALPAPLLRLSLMEFLGPQQGQFHLHEGHQILLCLEGGIVFENPAGELLTLGPGDVAIIPPGMPHRWDTPDGRRCEVLETVFMPVSREALGDVARFVGDPEHPAWRQARLELRDISPLAERIRAEILAPDVAGSGVVFGLTLAVFGYLSRRCADPADRLAGDPARHPVLAALRHIELHYREPLSVSELADKSHLGRSRFCELFRQATGMSPGKYVHQYRLKKAEGLLRYSHLRVKQVADYLGFSSEGHFSRAFKAYAGVPPTDFRDAAREAATAAALPPDIRPHAAARASKHLGPDVSADPTRRRPRARRR